MRTNNTITLLWMLTLGACLGITAALGGCTGQDSADATAAANVADAEGQLVELSVEGMTCGGCAHSVRQMIAKVDGVNACEVSLENKSASVRVNDESIVPRILGAFEETSYKVATKAN